MNEERISINWGLPEVPPDTIAALELDEKVMFLERLLDGQGPMIAGWSIGWSPQHIRKVMKDPEIADIIEAIEQGKDENVMRAVYRTALAGNVTAQQMWLYNRRPDAWKDTKRIVVERSDKLSIEVVHSVRTAALELLQQAGVKALQPGGGLDVIDVEASDDT